MRPPELLQNFSEPQDEAFPLGIDRRDGSKGFFLTDCGGFFHDMLAVARDEHLSVFDVFRKEILCQKSFDEDDEITSVVYHHLLSSDPEGQPGILVGVNNVKQQKFLVYVLSICMGEATILRKVNIPHPITCLRTLVSSYRMEQAKVALHPKMMIMPHVICVGTKNGHCYIGQLAISDNIRPDDWEEELDIRMTDALKDYKSRESAEFEYQAYGQRARKFPLDEVYVSAIGFVERARTLVIGLNFGGIVVCSLSDKPSIETVPHQMLNNEPKFIEAMVPENDPRPRLYFAVAFDCSQNLAAGITLFVMEFPSDERDSVHDPTQWQYRDLAVIPFIQISTPDMRAWISMRCIVGADSKYHAELNETISINTGPSAAHSRTLLSFFYLSRDQETRRLKIMGGLFDLNQHYYKRQIPRIIYDGTLANQCPFISFVHDTPCKMMEGFYPLEAIVDPKSLRRFTSDISNDLVLFYPSSYEIPCVYFTDGLVVRQLSAGSIQQQVLKRIVNNLYDSLCEPDPPFAWLQSIGLIQATLDETSGAEQAIAGVLANVVYHHYTNELVNLCRNEKRPLPYEVLQIVFEWIWSEAERQYQNMHNIVDPLFRGVSVDLNDADRRSLNACESIFGCAQRILPLNLELLNGEAAGIWELRSNTAQAFLHCLTLIYSLLCDKMLPVNDQTRRITQRMKERIETRRVAATRKEKQLYLDALLQRVYERVQRKTDLIWLDRDMARSYPPTLLDLVSLFPIFDVSGKLKRALLVYYLLDYHSAAGSNNLMMSLEDFYAGNGRKIRLTREELQSVYAEWLGDVALETVDEIESATEGDLVTPVIDVRKELFEATTKLIGSDGYNQNQAVRIQNLMERIYGHPLDKIMWNLLLIDHACYDEVDIEIVVPEGLESDHRVQRYLMMAEYLRLANYKSVKVHKDKFSLSKEILDKYRARSQGVENLNLNKDSPQTSLFRVENYSKKLKQMNLDPQALPNKLENLANSPENRENATFVVSPKNAMVLHLDDDDTSISFMNHVPADKLDQLRQIIQTPKARANAAARAEGNFRSNIVTPEQVKELPPPTSILRSVHKQTPTRGNIRWDPTVLSPAGVFSDDDFPMTTTKSPIPPIFDDDDDDNTNEASEETGQADYGESIESEQQEAENSDEPKPVADENEMSKDEKDNYYGEESFRIISREEQPDDELESPQPVSSSPSKEPNPCKETIQLHYTYKEVEEVHVEDQVVQKVTNIETTTIRVYPDEELIDPKAANFDGDGTRKEPVTPAIQSEHSTESTSDQLKPMTLDEKELEKDVTKEKPIVPLSSEKAASVSPAKGNFTCQTPTKQAVDEVSLRRSSRKKTPIATFNPLPEARRSPSRSTRKNNQDAEKVAQDKQTQIVSQDIAETSTSKVSPSRQLFKAETAKRKPLEQRMVKLEDVLPRKGQKKRTNSESIATTADEEQRRTPSRPKRAISAPKNSVSVSGWSSTAGSALGRVTALETVQETPALKEKATPRRQLKSVTKEKNVDGETHTELADNSQRTPSTRKRATTEKKENVKKSRKN